MQAFSELSIFLIEFFLFNNGDKNPFEQFLIIEMWLLGFDVIPHSNKIRLAHFLHFVNSKSQLPQHFLRLTNILSDYILLIYQFGHFHQHGFLLPL